MLGNFSFGDYYKEDAIAYAWELLTSDKWFNLDVKKLHFTIFGGAELSPGVNVGLDSLSRNTWVKAGAPQERVIALEGNQGIKELFWTMGETGPCGSCSEIHYDMGPTASEEGHADCKFPCDCGRYVEIWNLVFMQWNRDVSGNLTPLPKPSVDTGMGLERIAAVLQGVISNYDTDLFVPLMKRAAEVCGVDFEREEKLEEGKGGAASLRVIADHARATTFLITDGVIPSNEGRGYVLRKIMRRAIRHGRLLGATKPFLSDMVNTVRGLMSGAYPELLESQGRVSRVVDAEETRFARTLNIALSKLDHLIHSAVEGLDSTPDHVISDVVGGASKTQVEYIRRRAHELDGEEALKVARIIHGEDAFKLSDTYGLQRDFIEDVARDAGESGLACF